MSRRVSLAGLILVVAIWTGVLLTPQLHVLLDSQRRPPDEWVGQWMQNRLEYRDGSLERLLREHPNDPRILAAQVEVLATEKMAALTERTGDDRKARLLGYDSLIEKFPREEWLIQNRLRFSTSGGILFDIGEFATPQQKRDTKLWLSHEELLQAMKVAERGVQLNPQNSFYDWMRATFLFALNRPEEALRALADGASKPHFDDGVLRAMQIRIEVREMQGLLLWEERMGIMAAMLLPHYVPIRNVNRAAVWRGVLAERKGNHKRALQIYGNQMKLAATMGQDSTNLISMLVAESLMRDAWSGLTRRGQDKKNNVSEPAQPVREKIRRETVEFSRAFADYANKHGRNDLAQTALRLAREAEAMNLQKTAEWGYIFGAEKMDTMQRIGQSHWSGVVVLRVIVVLASAWIVLSLISLPVHEVRVLLPPLDVLASTLFSASTVAVVFFAALRIGVGEPLFLELFGGDDARQDNLRVLVPYLETILTWLPLGLTVLYCGVTTMWRARKNPSLPVRSSQNISIEERSLSAQMKSGLRFSVILLGVLTLCYAIVVWMTWLMNLSTIGANNETFLLVVPLVLAALVFYLWRQRKAYFHNWPYLLAWCRSTLGALVVAGSAAYLCTSLLVLPLRREADARLDNFIARGEVAVLRDLAAKRER